PGPVGDGDSVDIPGTMVAGQWWRSCHTLPAGAA
ncbi:MAG: hypothetical protein K0R81_3008, partial [Microbacterium sp.]|nr:hypothetical protein [Microbacterium sp.]